jgi:hypothetical protein
LPGGLAGPTGWGITGYGLWPMGYGLWPMDFELWATVYVIYYQGVIFILTDNTCNKIYINI